MKVLVLSYSQSGQLDDILHNLLRPLVHYSIEYVQIKPSKAFPFPWTSAAFFDAMPETVLEEPVELEPIELAHHDYDLVILGYQPWFLSPSLPISSLLRSEAFKTVINGKPVISVIGSRNMWMNAQTSVNKQVTEAGGRLVANIPFIDKTNNLVSAVTILHWMLSGKKERMWGIFPFPGVGRGDIEGASEFGKIILSCIENDGFDGLQRKIVDINGIGVPTNILFIEKRAKMMFRIWAKMIKRVGKGKRSRHICVSVFKYYLLIALFLVAPVVLLVYNVLFLPFFLKSVTREKQRIMLNDFQTL
ncbi:MAG: hypothetical protein QM786_11765 [Breznakibacter sp.]